MKRVLTALILAPLVLVLVFLGPMWLITLAVAGVAMLAAWEFLALTEHRGAKPPKVLTLGTIGLLFAGNYQWPDETVTIFGLFCIVLLVYCTFASPVERALGRRDFFGLCAVLSRADTDSDPHACARRPTGLRCWHFLFLTVWAGDTVAMYAGRAFGKRKLAPNLSPNKTWAGAIGSVVGAMAVAGILLALSPISPSGTP